MLDQLFIAPYLLKEHLDGKSIKESYRLKVVSLRRYTEGNRQMGELPRVRCAMVNNSRNGKQGAGRLDTASPSMALFNSGRRTLGDVRPLDAEPGIEPRLGPF
jgi:hypothetical protein